MEDETYLGDGLFASYDGWMVKLRAPREDGVNHWVGLEPEVWERLLIMIMEINRKREKDAGGG